MVAIVVSLSGAFWLPISQQDAFVISHALEYVFKSFGYYAKIIFAILTLYRKGKTQWAPGLGPPVVTHEVSTGQLSEQ